jgi:hypothetical protein
MMNLLRLMAVIASATFGISLPGARARAAGPEGTLGREMVVKEMGRVFVEGGENAVGMADREIGALIGEN